MPLYRFHIQSAGVVDSDPAGVELGSLAEAHGRAVKMMDRIIEGVGTADSADWWLVVKETDEVVGQSSTADLVVVAPRAGRPPGKKHRWVRWRT